MEAYKFIQFNEDGSQTVRGIVLMPSPGKDKEKDADIVKEFKNRKVQYVPVTCQGDAIILDFQAV